jgi:uncharacterized membrane protein YciS (DUF1049 family)
VKPVIPGFILDEVVKARVHGVFSSDVGLDSLNVLKDFLFIVPIVVIKVVIVGFYVSFHHFQYLFAHVGLGIGSVYCFVDEVGQLLHFLNCICGGLHLNWEVMETGLERLVCADDFVLFIQLEYNKI